MHLLKWYVAVETGRCIDILRASVDDIVGNEAPNPASKIDSDWNHWSFINPERLPGGGAKLVFSFSTTLQHYT